MLILKVISFLFLIAASSAQTDDLWQTSRSQWFAAEQMPIVGLEVELTGLSQRQTADSLQQFLGGTLSQEIRKFEAQDSKGRPLIWEVPLYKIKDSRIGSVRIELDENGVSNRILSPENAVVEIVTSPLRAAEVELFDRALLQLRAQGAQGIESQKPMAIQLNMQIGDGTRESIRIAGVLALLRNYLGPTHRRILERNFHIPENRSRYVGLYSQPMMTRILDPNYSPSAREFYDDFLYRQILATLGHTDAWTSAIESVRTRVQKELPKRDIESILPVIKWNYVRLSSLLLFMFPDDWLSQYLINSKWVKALPLVEIREPSSDFRLREYYEALGGLYIKSFRDGPFTFLEKQNFILKRDLEKVEQLAQRAQQEPFVVRTMLYDGKSDPYQDPLASYYLKKYEKERSTLVFLNSEDRPAEPFLVPGESVVFHNLPDLAHILRGKYNPALANSQVGSFIEHKYYEFLFWNQFAPGSMSHTIQLSQIVHKGMSGKQLQDRLNKLFPEGWVLKGALESATQEQYIITDKNDLQTELDIYSELAEDFQTRRDRILSESKGDNPDLLARGIREHKAFAGWRLKRYLKRPQDAIVQARVNIAAEYRVEAISGRILGGDSTIPRYQYEIPEGESWKNQKEIETVERFAANLLARLPPRLRMTLFAFDIALDSTGKPILIESNPLSNSGFLSYDKRGIKALNRFLLEYPELLRSGVVNEGLSQAEQKLFIDEFKSRLHSPDCSELVI